MVKNKFEGNSEIIVTVLPGRRDVVLRQNLSHVTIPTPLLEEALQEIKPADLPPPGEVATFTHDFAEQVGFADVVETDASDLEAGRVFYAPRTDRAGKARRDGRSSKIRWTRWVVGKEQPQASQISFVLLCPRQGSSSLSSLVVLMAHFGPPIRKEPDDSLASKEDCLWWFNPLSKSGHAFVVPLLLAEMTASCPWDFAAGANTQPAKQSPGSSAKRPRISPKEPPHDIQGSAENHWSQFD